MRTMLRKLLLLTALLSLTLFVGCQSNEESTAISGTNSIMENPKTTEDNTLKQINGTLTGWISNGFNKYARDAKPPYEIEKTFALHMAKNETELCQLSFRCEKAGESAAGLSLSCSYVPDGFTTSFLREYTVETNSGEFTPDPVVQLTEAFSVENGETVTILFKCTASAAAPAGDTAFTISLTDETGTVIDTYTVNVHVWNFALPETSRCVTAVGLYREPIAQMHLAFTDAKIDMLYKAYYDLLLSYKVCAYDLPYDILDAEADAYMSDPRVTSFRIPYSDNDDTIRAYYEKLSQNPVWFSKAYFYPLDEPTSKEHLDHLAVISERLERLFPNYRICTPFFRDIDYDSSTDQIAFMTGKTNIWCPKSFLYADETINSIQKAHGYASFYDRMAERKAAGDDVWWYVCWEPGNPYCNLFLDQKGIQHRILFWQQKDCQADGFLYWGVNFWNGVEDPWEDMRTVKELSMSVFGDGSLLYNGNKVGINGAVASVRLEDIRDGIEDFDLLTLASETLGAEYVHQKIQEISPSLTEYTTAAEDFIRVRNEIGEALEAAINS